MTNNLNDNYNSDSGSLENLDSAHNHLFFKVATVAILVCLLAAVGIGFVSQLVVSPVEIAQQEEIVRLQDELEDAGTRLGSLSERLEELAETDRELYRTILEAEPISEVEFQMGVGGSEMDDYAYFPGTSNRLVRRTAARFDQLERQMALQSRSYQELIRLAAAREVAIEQLPAILPVQDGRLASGFGMRYHPILHTVRMHDGVDFVVPSGTPVYATGGGVIRKTETENGYGLTVEIEHTEAKRFTRYAHLSRIEQGIRPGVEVERGQIIAYSGNSGLSTAPHLHYEVRRLDAAETALDPVGFFAPAVEPEEFLRIRQISRMETASFD